MNMKQSEKNHDTVKDSYKPISCNVYDKLESDAVTGKISRIQYKIEGEVLSIQSKIKTFKIKGGAEYMILENGSEIRLDHIISFNDSPVTPR